MLKGTSCDSYVSCFSVRRCQCAEDSDTAEKDADVMCVEDDVDVAATSSNVVVDIVGSCSVWFGVVFIYLFIF